MCSPLTAFTEAREQFLGLDREEMARRSGALYIAEQDCLQIAYLGSVYTVSSGGQVALAAAPQREVPYNDRTLILQYLVQSSGLPPRGRWLSFLELPDGIHHYEPLKIDAMQPLARAFAGRLEQLDAAAHALGGRPISMGDRAFSFAALPKIPLAVVFWDGDDEFPARSNILYDAVAPAHLTTAALWVLGVELAHKLIAYLGAENAGCVVDWLGGKAEAGPSGTGR
ncbi:MAG: DUF3786 domain-containing protein [Desulfurispora sp.]|uniref:DUF3786 domain-containing protein n=1 Tax=Desulfurispora sp. TaxID=3014275 RepID=UPI00404A8080